MRNFKWIHCFVLVVCGFMLMGMGGFGGSSGPTRIPDPDKNYPVTIIDQADVSTNLTRFTIGGYTYFFGKRGKGQLAVPFENIHRADFRMKPEGGLEVLLQLKNGEKVVLSSSRKQEAFGVASVGNFSIVLGDIKMIEFGKRIVPKAAKK